MIRRLTIIAFFTGLGQLFTIFTLKYVSKYAQPADLKAIAEIDSSLLLVLNILAMGLQSAAMRDLALSPQWKEEYSQIQSARQSLGIILIALGALAWINPYYLVFAFAPVLAWNGDFALYARGSAIAGSLIACIRLLIPFSAILLAARSGITGLPWIYLAASIIIYAITNTAISLYLKTTVFFLPQFRNLHLYVKSLSLGVVILSLYFIGLGLMLVIPYFFSSPVVGVAFLGLKLYMIFKGLLRIIHQAFIREMVSFDVCFKVDQLASLIGLTFFGFMIIFPHSVIRTLFGEQYIPEQAFFVFLAAANLVYSLFSSLIIKVMLEKKDRQNAMMTLAAALFTITLTMGLSLFSQRSFVIGISLVSGELLLASGMIFLVKKPSVIPRRVFFLLKNSLLLLIPLITRFFLGDSLLFAGIALGLFGVLLAMKYYNQFSVPATH